MKWQTCLVYQDDVIVFSRSPEEQPVQLEQVLHLSKEKGPCLEPLKYHLFQKEVEYLGHIIRSGRVAEGEKNTKALKGHHYPRTQNQLKSILGMCGACHQLEPGFAKVAKPLNVLTSTRLSNDLPPLTGKTPKAFDTLRELFLNGTAGAKHGTLPS